MYTCDVCVVGAGMVGSATARHILELDPTLKVALIGPAERQARDSDIHGAYYDEGRITRVTDPDPVWALLAKRSMRRFRLLEKKSGVSFYHEVGYASIGLKGGPYITNSQQNAETLHQPVDVMSSEALNLRYPYMRFDNHAQGLFTKTQAGHLNPRKLVEAQQRAAEQLGCTIIDDIAASVTNMKEDNSTDVAIGASSCSQWRVRTEGGILVLSEKVLLATGAFTDARKLMPGGLLPDLRLLSQTVILIPIEGAQLREMEGMPCFVCKGYKQCPSTGRLEDSKHNFEAYIHPPIKYPDGKYYLKLGHGDIDARVLRSPQEVDIWYTVGRDFMVEEHLLQLTNKYFPDVSTAGHHFGRGVTSHSRSDRPYIDTVCPGLGIALGNCGYAAKSSDEIGRVAARMMVKGQWDYDLPASHFKYQTMAKGTQNIPTGRDNEDSAEQKPQSTSKL